MLLISMYFFFTLYYNWYIPLIRSVDKDANEYQTISRNNRQHCRN